MQNLLCDSHGWALLEIDGRTYAFIGLEQTTKEAEVVFNITNPRKAIFVDMIVTNGDISPEGLAAISLCIPTLP